MRKSLFSICVVCLCASFALAQGKVANEWKCAKPTMQHSIEVGDQANHAYSISQTKCAATKGEIGGVKEKEGTGTDFIEVTGNNSSGHGVFVETMANWRQAQLHLHCKRHDEERANGFRKQQVAVHRRHREVQGHQGRRYLQRNGQPGRVHHLDL